MRKTFSILMCANLLFACERGKGAAKPEASFAPAKALASPPDGSQLVPVDMSRTSALIPKTEGLAVLTPFALQGGTNYMAGAVYCGPSDEAATRALLNKALLDAGWRPIEEKAPNEPANLIKFELPPNVLIFKPGDVAAECFEGKGRKLQVTHLKRMT